jgi:hypothetical protein
VAEALDRAEGLMREAARELANGRGERGAELQREAQRWLDQQDDEERGQSDKPQDDAPPPDDGDSSSDKGSMRQDAGVPGRDKNQRAEEFRQRVLKGLAKDKGGRLGPAVKRYAEGLLK